MATQNGEIKTISFHVTKGEYRAINNIAQRAHAMAQAAGVDYPVLEAHMDVTACHANGCPLKLSELAAADDFNFAHDVFGIRRHINRETGQLENCFLPRFAAPTERQLQIKHDLA